MMQCEMGQWYVAYSKPHKEEVAQFHLLRKGVEVFFPRLLLAQSLPKHRQLVPLFPNYLFVKIQEPEEFGYARLETQLRRAQTDSADAVLFSVLGAVQDFAATHPLVDDMSLVIVRRRM